MRSSGAIWENQVEHVRAAGHEAVAVDLPAHGARRHDRFSMDGAFEALDDAVAGLPAGPIALVGLSLGGYTSLAWAARPGAGDRLVGILAAGLHLGPEGQARAALPGRRQGRRERRLPRPPADRPGGAPERAPSAPLRALGTPPFRPLRSAPGGSDLRQVEIAPHQTAEMYRPTWDVVTDALTHLAGRSSIANVRATHGSRSGSSTAPATPCASGSNATSPRPTTGRSWSSPVRATTSTWRPPRPSTGCSPGRLRTSTGVRETLGV